MNWFKKLFGGADKKGEEPSPASKTASWLESDSPDNPFGVRILNLMDNLQLLSTSKDAKAAEMAVSWRPGDQRRLEVKREGEGTPCDLSYPIGNRLPDGMLFLPRAMEDKWVIAWREGAVIFARSWSGETAVTIDAHIEEDGRLHLTRIYTEDSGLEPFGELERVVDWMIRSHALDERLPLPIDAESAELLHGMPLIGMNIFGHRLFCAGIDYEMKPTENLLCSFGDLSASIYENDSEAFRRLASVDAWQTPTASDGSPPLVLAAILGHADLCKLMLELGSNVEVRNARGGTALQGAVAGKHGRELVSVLLDAGADLEAVNVDGFTALHAAAEVGDAAMVKFLTERGASLESRTQMGFCPIHIAAGLGHKDAAEALVASGADANLLGGGKTPAVIAREEGHKDLAVWFESLGR